MKRYVYVALLALLAQCSLSNVLYSMNIAPVTVGPDSIVNAIKQYSDLTEADVNQYKLLWLGSLGTTGAFLAGAASTIGAGVKAYQQAGAVQAITPERVPSWMTNALVLAGLGSTGAGYMSYKLLYPRIREGVLSKVQKFIDVCETLYLDSPADSTGTIYSIVTYNFGLGYHNQLGMLQAYLPTHWPVNDGVAVYNALDNLAKQGQRAQALLNQIRTSDDELNNMKEVVKTYSANLSANAKLYEPMINAEYRKRRAAAELAGIEAGTSLMKAKTIETYGTMVTSTVKNAWKGLNFLYENKQYVMGAAASIGLMSAYNYVKSKLGY